MLKWQELTILGKDFDQLGLGFKNIVTPDNSPGIRMASSLPIPYPTPLEAPVTTTTFPKPAIFSQNLYQ